MALKDIFVIIRQPKSDPDAWQIVGQTPDPEQAKDIISSTNNNETFVKKADGTISGNKSIIQSFTKDELREGLGSTESI